MSFTLKQNLPSQPDTTTPPFSRRSPRRFFKRQPSESSHLSTERSLSKSKKDRDREREESGVAYIRMPLEMLEIGKEKGIGRQVGRLAQLGTGRVDRGGDGVLERRIQALESDLVLKSQQTNDIQSQLRTLTASYLTLTSQHTLLTTTHSATLSKLSLIQQSLRTTSLSLKKLQHQNTALQKKIQFLQKIQFTSDTKNIQSLRETHLQSQLITLKSKLQSSKSQMELLLENQVIELREEIFTTKRTVESLQISNDCLQKRLEENVGLVMQEENYRELKGKYRKFLGEYKELKKLHEGVMKENRMLKAQVRYIDLRSDTVTVPTPLMRQAMSQVANGDDVYNDDPIIVKFIDTVKTMFKKEAGVFLPSGVMANQLAILAWTNPGDEIILWDRAHSADMENGSIAVLAGVQARMVQSETGILKTEEVEPLIRMEKGPWYPKTALLCLENSVGNGRVYPIERLKQLKQLAEKNEMKVHTDGARIFSAAQYLKLPVDQVVQHTDSISFCLSKGLCCAFGSILLGPAAFIQKVDYYKKCLLGTTRQGGLFAAAGLVALQEIVPGIKEDHEIAKLLTVGLSKIRGVVLDPETVFTNIIFFRIDTGVKCVKGLFSHLLDRKIQFRPANAEGLYRIVVHHYVRKEEAEKVLTAFKEYFEGEGK